MTKPSALDEIKHISLEGKNFDMFKGHTEETYQWSELDLVFNFTELVASQHNMAIEANTLGDIARECNAEVSHYVGHKQFLDEGKTYHNNIFFTVLRFSNVNDLLMAKLSAPSGYNF